MVLNQFSMKAQLKIKQWKKKKQSHSAVPSVARRREEKYSEKYVMRDYLDSVAFFKWKKGMTEEQGDAYWRKLLADENLPKDELGLDPEFTTRIEIKETCLTCT